MSVSLINIKKKTTIAANRNGLTNGTMALAAPRGIDASAKPRPLLTASYTFR